jgi:anti-sigma regulatory factor (Ser/Thr protein kinase)
VEVYDSRMSKAEVTLPAAVSSVPTARHFVESILAGWGFSDLSWPATLIVSELAANAALHARGESFSVRILGEPDCVRLEVTDGSLRLPQQRTYSADATTGRGLRLVAELAQEWGVAPSATGKTIWVVLRTSEAGSGADDEVDLDALLDAFSDEDIAPVTELPNRPTATGRAIAA